MPNQLFSAHLIVNAGGGPIPAWIRRELVSWEVSDNRTTPDSFLLRFNDPSYTIIDDSTFAIGAAIELSIATAKSASPQPLLVGDMTAIEMEYTDRKVFAVVRGLDASHRLYRGRRSESYEGQSVREIVEKVCKRAGLTMGDLDGVSAGGTRKVVNQVYESDAAFLDRLTRQLGAQWWVIKRQLHVKSLQPPQGAPAASTLPHRDNLVLDPSHGLVSLLASACAAGQVRQVLVPGWDPVKKETVLGRADVDHPSAEVDGISSSTFAGSFGGEVPPLVYGGTICTSQDQADAAAQSIATHIASGLIELDGTSIGNPEMRAGVAVTISAAVKRFAGRYVLTSTRHYQNTRGAYLTDFIASGWADRSLSGLMASVATAGSSSAMVPASNIMIGVIKNIDDPDKLGRVRINIPAVGENHKTGWIPVMYPGAGSASGMVAPLAVGVQVLVAVPCGDPDAAVVMGGLHNQKDTMPTLPEGVDYYDTMTGKAQGMCVTAPGGAQLAIIDSSKAKMIRLSTADNKHIIEIDQSNSAITIKSNGKIVVEGSQGVSIEASGGAVDIKGTSVSIDAGGGSVKIKGSTVSLG